MNLRVAGVAIACACTAVPAEADPRANGDGYLGRLVRDVRTRLDDLAAGHAPKIVPPVPVAVTWKQAKLISFDPGAPLLALMGADLDGDGKAELYAVTAREVIALGWRGSRFTELGRVSFSGDPAVPAPRDPVGTVHVRGAQLIAASSAWAKELVVGWNKKALVGQLGGAGFQRCAHNRAALRPGRNHFDDNTYGKRCRDDLVDPQGYPLHATATLATSGKLTVDLEQCQPGGATCRPAGTYAFTSGVAFEIGDVDRDGKPEVIVTGTGAPGDGDFVKVTTIGGATLFTSKPTMGGVVGIAAADLDGNGVGEVVVAIRLAGGTHLDLMRLD
ncbi:MAG: VCBS repeat-containing protein [Deltaproteobacteria bacterium]|nr:VCBS repeat-containing protein [Deltaproteobacteria bacterium]